MIDDKVVSVGHNMKISLTLKAPIMTTALTTFINTFSLILEKIRRDVSSESSARQRIHIKNQA